MNQSFNAVTPMKRHVLVVEDEPLLALDLADELSRAGFDVLGPATTVASALGLLEVGRCDAAVLDVLLGNELSAPIVLRLQALRIPFVVITGYSSEQLSPEFACAVVLSKPARAEELISTLEKCIKGGDDCSPAR